MTTWIKVKHKVPDTDDMVLTYCRENRPRFALGFYSILCKKWRCIYPNDPTDWMPLPKKPKDDY